MPLLDHLAENARLPLPNADLALKVVAIHQSQRVQDVANGEIIKWLIGQLPLREQLPHHLLSFVDGVLSQANVGRIYKLLSQLKISVIHNKLI